MNTKAFYLNIQSLQDCDILVSASMTPSRFKWLDFTNPSTYLPIGYLIPKAESAVSLTSIFQPFSKEVYCWNSYTLAYFHIVLVSWTILVCNARYFFTDILCIFKSSNEKKYIYERSYLLSKNTITNHYVNFHIIHKKVWMTLIGSTIFVIVVLHLMNWFLEKLTQTKNNMLKDAGLLTVSVTLHQRNIWIIHKSFE